MAASCWRCGADILWANVEGEGRIALNSMPQMRLPSSPQMALYRLKSESQTEAERITEGAHIPGYAAHRETCRA